MQLVAKSLLCLVTECLIHLRCVDALEAHFDLLVTGGQDGDRVTVGDGNDLSFEGEGAEGGEEE